MWFGVLVMAYSLLINTCFSMLINTWPNRKLLGYRLKDQLMDIAPSIVNALIMGLCVYTIQYLELGHLVTILIQIPLGAIIYIVLSKVMKNDAFVYLIDIIKSKINKK